MAPTLASGLAITTSNGMSTSELRSDLRPLIFPQSAALIGVSPRTGPEVIDNVIGRGMRVVAVHPRETNFGSLEHYANVAELPWVSELGFMLDDAKVISRAGSPAALDAVARVQVAVGRLAVDHPEVVAVDINPLVLDDHGATALDALVIVEGGQR